jgi:hypothetical protein
MRPTLSMFGLISVNLQDLHYSARRWSHSRQHSNRVERRLGRLAGTVAGVAVAAALQAVDGIALKVTVDRWAAATGDVRVVVYEAALAVRQIEIGLAALLSITTGLALIAFSFAMLVSMRYPHWVGVIGLLDGLGMAAAGGAQASSGFSALAMTISMTASSVLLLWIILAGILMWRLAPRLGNNADERAFSSHG